MTGLLKGKLEELKDVFPDEATALFFIAWVKNGLNAKKAYLKLHPDVGEHSAETLGSRMLKKVEVSAVLSAYGLGIETYFDQLKAGLEAAKWNDFTGEREPDHKTRRAYHEVLGKLHGFEGKQVENIVQQEPIKVIITDYVRPEASPKNTNY